MALAIWAGLFSPKVVVSEHLVIENGVGESPDNTSPCKVPSRSNSR